MVKETLVRLRDVSWQPEEQAIVQNVSLAIHASEIVTIIGPNGGGKTALVGLVTGLIKPSSGDIFKRHNLRIGYMPQHLRFDTSLPLDVGRFLRLASSDQQAVDLLSERLGITAIRHHQMHNLSGGEMQRVLLTRAALRKPDLLVLDEPGQGVDILGQAELYRIISELRDELKCGVLMVSHDLHLVMARTDTVICLNRHVCCQGEPESVGKHPEFLQLFGQQAAAEIAVYTHRHDHQHDLHGDIIDNHQCGHDHDH